MRLTSSLAGTAFLLSAGMAFAQQQGRWKSLDYLYSISGKGTVAGVHNKHSRTPSSFTDQVQQVSGRTPGLWSGDFLFNTENIDNRVTMIKEAEEQWESGALVNIMWHACNPTLSEPCNWSEHCHGNGPWSDISDGDWQQLITDGTQLNNRWKQMMDDISQHLIYLKDNGVEVMFRPLHEMNQGCFWWGGRPGPNGSRRLYQITHDYLTNVKGLDNLIWTWNIQDFGSLEQDAIDYNPGNDYWEVASLDVYEGFQKWKYDVMRNVANGKPFTIGECAILPEPDRLSNEPFWKFFMSWSELTFQDNSDDKIRRVYDSGQVITLDEMPGWDGNIPPPPASSARTFRSYHNTYLSGWDDGTLKLQGHAQGWEQWTVEEIGNGNIALRSHQGRYLSAWTDGSVRTAGHRQEWEHWTEVSNSDGSISLRSFHGTYLSAWTDGSVRLADHNRNWEHWWN